MNIKYLVATAGVVSLLISGQAWSQEDDSEATIRLMRRADSLLLDAVTNEIALPAAVPDDAAAEQAITKREAGLDRAQEALESNEAMLQTARDNVDERSRSDVPSGPPTDPAQPPGTP